jgi:hypothetical protein
MCQLAALLNLTEARPSIFPSGDPIPHRPVAHQHPVKPVPASGEDAKNVEMCRMAAIHDRDPGASPSARFLPLERQAGDDRGQHAQRA